MWLPGHFQWPTNSNFMAKLQHTSDGNEQSITEQWLSAHCSTSSTQHRLNRTPFWWSTINTSKIWTTHSWQLATWQWRHMTLHTRFQQPLQGLSLPHNCYFCWWNHQDLNLQRNHWLLLHHWWKTKSILGLQDEYLVEGLSHHLLSLTTIFASQNFTIVIKNCATTILFPDDLTYTRPLLLHKLPTQQAFSTMAQPENATPGETTFSPTFE
jgi:hypothetical protein